MTAQLRLGMLFARLQLMAPGARSILLVAPRHEVDVRGTSRQFAAAIAAGGHPVRLIDLAGPDPGDVPPGVEEAPVTPDMITDPGAAALALRAGAAYTVISGRGLLEDAPTLLMAAAADAVVVAARAGRSYRADLAEVRLEVERAGGRLIGAILLG